MDFFQKQSLSRAATESVPYAAAVQQQQRYIGSRLSISCLSASSHGAYVWLVHNRSERVRGQCNNQTLIVGPHTRYTKYTAGAKAVVRVITNAYHMELLSSPFSTCEPPRISSESHPEREPCMSHDMYGMITRIIIAKIWPLCVCPHSLVSYIVCPHSLVSYNIGPRTALDVVCVEICHTPICRGIQLGLRAFP